MPRRLLVDERWLWHIVRIPAVMLLVILEPIVASRGGSGVARGADHALLRAPPRAPFPEGTMLAVSIGFRSSSYCMRV